MKTKIAALITALLIIVIGAVGVYYISKTGSDIQGITDTSDQAGPEGLPENQSVRYIEEPTDTRIEDWLKFIGKQLNLETMSMYNSSFVWETEIDEEEVSGQTLSLDNITDGTIDTVKGLFEEYEFVQNELNTIEEEFPTYGYEKDDIVCSLKVSEKETEVEIIQNLEIECGLINPQAILIKKLYSEKLGVDPSTIQVEIIQSTMDHISGSIQFNEPDEEAAISNGIESFLAAKDENGDWVLVISGNETLTCDLVKPYNFPAEMVPECFDDGTGKMMERENLQPEVETEIETDQTAP